jgi:chromosome partitioning protein
MTLVTSIINFKGGVGKTTTAINLATCLTQQGKKVLVIDMDAQGNVGMGLGIDVYKIGLNTIGDVLATGSVAIERCIIKTQYFDVIPNNLHTYLKTNKRGSYDILTDALETIKKKYDFVLIDTPPSIEFYTCNAIMASDMLLVVTEYSKFSVQGVRILMSVFDAMSGKVASKLKYSPRAILFTMYQNNTTFKALTNQIEKETQLGLFLDVKIPRSAEVNKMTYQGMPVTAKRSKANAKIVDAYQTLAEQMIDFAKIGKIYNTKYSVSF